MAWFEDLTPCSYFGIDLGQALRAIGWLQRGQPFPIGSVASSVYEKLVEMCKDPWQPATPCGVHGCDLCQYKAESFGTKNLFVPGIRWLYVCPELIVHYMNAHAYAPPAEFCEAVLACPAMKSMEYRRSILANGGRPLVKWASE